MIKQDLYEESSRGCYGYLLRVRTQLIDNRHRVLDRPYRQTGPLSATRLALHGRFRSELQWKSPKSGEMPGEICQDLRGLLLEIEGLCRSNSGGRQTAGGGKEDREYRREGQMEHLAKPTSAQQLRK